MAKMGTVWDRTAEFLSDNIAAVVPVALVTFFVPASIQGNFAALVLRGSWELQLGLTLVQVAFGVLSMWGSLTIAALALDMGDMRAAAAVAGRRLLPMIVISVTLLAALVLLVMPVPLVLGASGVDFMAASQGAQLQVPASAAGFVVIYYLFLLLLILWTSARLMIVTPVLLREGRMFGAIPQSWRLTRGHTLRIVGVLILFAIVAVVSVLAATTVFGSIFALVVGGNGEGVSLATVLTSIVQAAVQTAFMVIAPAFTAKLYLALTAEAGLQGTLSRA